MVVKVGDRLTLKFKSHQASGSIVSIDEVEDENYVPHNFDDPQLVSRSIVVCLDNDPDQEYAEVVAFEPDGWGRLTIPELEIALSHKLEHSGKMPTPEEKKLKKFNAVKLGGGDLQM